MDFEYLIFIFFKKDFVPNFATDNSIFVLYCMI